MRNCLKFKFLVHIHDRDLFAEFHMKKLTQRLLFDKSDPDEAVHLKD